jgi:hypothetical protein
MLAFLCRKCRRASIRPVRAGDKRTSRSIGANHQLIVAAAPIRRPDFQAFVRQPLNSAFLVAIKISYPVLPEIRTPCRDPPSARRLVAEPQAEASRPSPKTPSTVSTSSQKGEKVYPCVRYSVTYVPGRSIDNRDSALRREIVVTVVTVVTMPTVS